MELRCNTSATTIIIIITVILLQHLQPSVTAPSLERVNSTSVAADAERQPVDKSLRRIKRQLGFWEVYYDRYLHRENYLPTEVDILSTPRVFRLLVNTLRRGAINYDTINDEVERFLDAYMKANYKVESTDYFRSYQPYSQMMAFMRKTVFRCKGRCSLFTIGKSHEGRPLMGIKIGTNKHGEKGEKRNIWIDAGIHPREWISHTTALYLADMLISGYVHDKFVRHMVDTYDWYILPCANPDGYIYTWTKNRLWRKTRRPIPGSKCFGADLNRNFGFKWGTSGASSNPCRSNYRGEKPYSEPEAKAMNDFIQSREKKGSWLLYITLHSKGQLIMSPWGYTSLKPAGYQQMELVGKRMAEAISNRHNMTYRFGSACSILYRSSGTSRDWAHGQADIPYVYTFELRDKGSNGWLLSPEHIIPTGEEIWAGLREAIKVLEETKVDRNVTKRKSSQKANRVIKTSPRVSRSRRYRLPVTW